MSERSTTGSLTGVGTLAGVELRRWLPRRAAVLTVVSLPILILVSLMFRGEADTPFGDILDLALTGWSIVVVIVVVATSQSVLAGDVEDGTAAWTVSMPVTRRAYVVAKFLGAAPAVALGAVVVPGLLAYPVLASAATTKEDFGAAAVLDALRSDPSSYAGMPSVGEYAVMLLLIALFAVFLLAAMLFFGSRFTSTVALLALGLSTAGVLLVLNSAGVREGSPGVALVAVSPGALDQLAVIPALLASAVWSLVAVALAAWSFEGRSL